MISLLLAVCALGQTDALEVDGNVAVVWDGLTQAGIERAYTELKPGICLLTYTLEITNNRGEVSKRDNNAIGLIVSEDGLVMAHGHMVLENRKPFNIRATVGEGDDEEEYKVTLLRKPDDINVTFLKLEPEEDVTFSFVKFEEPSGLTLGAPVFSIGILNSALDHAKGLQTRRVGAIIKEPRLTYCLDSPISFGYIGGPVMDAKGRPIGVVGFDLSSNEGGDIYTRSGHPLIYQASLFQRYIDTPPVDDDAETDDAWLGIFTQPLTDDLAEYWGLEKDGGIVVSTVIPGSPAQEIGLLSGDVLTSFNGIPVNAKQDQEVLMFTKMVRESPIGVGVPVKLLRDGRPTELDLVLTTRPTSAADAEELEDELFGLTVREITTDLRIRMNLSEDVQGVHVRKVKPGSLANQARIRPGFVILQIGDQAVVSLESFAQILKSIEENRPSEVAVLCRLGASTAFFRIQPRWNNSGRE